MAEEGDSRAILQIANLTLRVEPRDGALVVWIVGRLDEQTVQRFRRSLESLFPEDFMTCVLDATDLTYINSDGLRVLLGCRRSLGQTSRGFAICSLSTTIRAVFEISGFDRVIPIHPDLEAALTGNRPSDA